MLLADGTRLTRTSTPIHQYADDINWRLLNNHNSSNVGISTNIIRIHPDFRVIFLANKPGFPFQGMLHSFCFQSFPLHLHPIHFFFHPGNNFYGEIGDVFSTTVVTNPPPASELDLLQQYAPNLPPAVLRRLVAAFDGLREEVYHLFFLSTSLYIIFFFLMR